MLITPLYAALLVLVFIALTVQVIRFRQRYQVALGDGGHAELGRAIRVHANFVEYVPLALLLLFFAEYQGLSGWLVHLLGAALLLGRVLHAYGVSKVRENLRFRISGMALTFSMLLVAVVSNLWFSLVT